MKKKKFITIIFIIIILRIIISCNLPSFYIKNMYYDDNYMVEQAKNIIKGNYLGTYNDKTLIKGLVFPFFIAFCKMLNISYTFSVTIIYIVGCSLLTYALKNNIKNKKLLLLTYILLLFNPISYSSDAFQRLYRNSLSASLILFFFSFLINIINSKNNKSNIINSLCLGIITSIMFLTREDNIWCIITILLLIIYKLKQKKNLKSFLINIIPFCILFLNLNIISLINYKYYNIYTYNELEKSNFKNAYIKIQEIKSEHKYNTVSITKNDLIKLANKSKKFKITSQEIDVMYREWADPNTQEINNGNMIWALRKLIYKKHQFSSGKEANQYFYELSEEIELLFQNKELEKEIIIPSVFINTPTIKHIKQLPKNIINTIIYTTKYKNIKTLEKKEFNKLKIINDKEINTNAIYINDYHNTENIVNNNPIVISIIKKIYYLFSVIFSIISVINMVFSINKNNKNKIIIYLILISYTMIIAGVAYTETTAFKSIRYFYLVYIYILQTIFIILNLNEINFKKNTKKILAKR